ncbi:MAG: hypothetical protein LBH81_01845 [Rickettsiales bacterium]|jgi:hypothetical protein|nr:hypothetical protein [Rickettsiales bacterium]
MRFNKILKITAALGLVLAVFMGAAEAAPAVNMQALCKEMGDIFKILRNLAFIGAAFVIAGWAWGFISGGKADMKDAKEKGIALLVGFIMLGAVGIVMQILGSTCTNVW